MIDLFAVENSGEPFRLFGTSHIIALSSLVLLLGATLSMGSSLSESARRRLRVGLAVVLVVNETFWQSWLVAAGRWTVQESLPFHLCSVAIVLSAVMLLRRSFRLFEYVYFVGVSGAIQALLTPNLESYGFPHVLFFQFFLSHGGMVLAAVLMIATEGCRPTLKSVARAYGWLFVHAMMVGLVNLATGSNYLFIARKPDTQSALDMLPPWPWYIPIMGAGVLATMLLLASPFLVARSRTKGAAD